MKVSREPLLLLGEMKVFCCPLGVRGGDHRQPSRSQLQAKCSQVTKLKYVRPRDQVSRVENVSLHEILGSKLFYDINIC